MNSKTRPKVAIVGYGSIGKRHYNVFCDLGATLAIVSSRNVDFPFVYQSIERCVLEFSPDIIVISNETSRHKESLKELFRLQYMGKILIEKPLFESYECFEHNLSSFISVAYNLRFHPVLLELKKRIIDKSLISVNIYCGQYLPTWRPDRDYHKSYSASKKCGGGVLRDLSHELDYAHWLFGKPLRVVALGGHFSSLNISSDDSYSILSQTSSCASISILINYLDYVPRREILVHCNECTYCADLVTSKLYENNTLILDAEGYSGTYHEQAQSVVSGDRSISATYEDGIFVMKLIEAIETSVEENRWVCI